MSFFFFFVIVSLLLFFFLSVSNYSLLVSLWWLLRKSSVMLLYVCRALLPFLERTLRPLMLNNFSRRFFWPLETCWIAAVSGELLCLHQQKRHHLSVLSANCHQTNNSMICEKRHIWNNFFALPPGVMLSLPETSLQNSLFVQAAIYNHLPVLRRV